MKQMKFNLGGMSSSLPVDVQEEMIRNVKGFENAKVNEICLCNRI